MLSQFRRGHHHEFDGGPMTARPINGHGEHWKSSDRANSSLLNNNILPDHYPLQPRSVSSVFNPDLSRAIRVDVHLLAIVRIEDKRNNFYSTEVVNKLRQKEQSQSFINKPCTLFVTDRSLVIYDRGSQIIAETVPLENVDPTCVYSDSPDTLNDIFMYRSFDRHSGNTSQNSISTSNDTSPVIVFKCSNQESRYLVDCIRNANGKSLKNPRSARSEQRSTLDRRKPDIVGMPFHDLPPLSHDHSSINNPTYVVGPQHTSRSVHHQQPTDHYKRFIDELNKCFDDIELFVRHLEAISEYTKELERDHRRKDKKSAGLKQMVERLPDDRYFIDILQKFKHSFNLLGELKHIIHNPNAPELVHYLLSPLQFILYTLRTKHPQQLLLAQDIGSPAITKEARDLLLNCLTSREHEVLKNLGPTWIRTAEETPSNFTDYRPIFFEGRPIWIQEVINDHPLQSVRSIDERQPSGWSTTRSNKNNNELSTNARQPSATRFDTSTVDRSRKHGGLENFNSQMQNEHAWAIERKRAGAKICAVKVDRKGQNNKELTVRRGELIEIENSAKKWWRARNFQGEVGHVPHNIVEEIEIEQRPVKSISSNPSAHAPRSSSVPTRRSSTINGYDQRNPDHYGQHLVRSPSQGNNFIMQSNNSTITQEQLFPQTHLPINSSIPPPPPSSTIPVPPPLPADFLTNRSSPWSTIKLPESARKARARLNTNLTEQQEDEFQQELTQRITDRVGLINQDSSKEEVQQWLASKHVSTKLAQQLSGMNGEQMFQLTKATLDQFTNETESARVYALLSQQKQLSGYKINNGYDRSPNINNSIRSSLKASTINDADDSLSFRFDDSLSRSLKIKLKKRRDKIEQSETTDRIVV